MASKARPLKYIISAVIVIVIAVIVAFVWRAHATAQPQYRTAVIKYGNVAETVQATGTINPEVIVNVGTQVSGTVQNLYADYNSHVTKGEVLLTIDPTIFKAQVAQQQANLASAEATLSYAMSNEARVRKLFKEGYGNKQAVDQAVEATANAEASVAAYKGQLQQAKTNLANTIIRSPVTGTVINREVSLGQTVAASFQTPTLFEIGQDLHKMQIDTTVNEADVGSIKSGQSATFTVSAFPSRTYHGAVKQVRLNATNTSNVVTYDVVVEVNNADLSLLPGMTANVTVLIQDRKHVLLVPNSALRVKLAGVGEPHGRRASGTGGIRGSGSAADRDGSRAQAAGSAAANGKVVYVLGPKGKPTPVRITLGVTDNLNTEVAAGPLHEGERVITGVLGLQQQGPQRSGFFRPF